MKIIVTRRNHNGSFDQVGMSNRALVSHYKTVNNAIRYFAKPFANGKDFKIEVFFSNLYQEKPDQILYFNGA